MHILQVFAILVLATASIAVTLTKAEVFRSLREKVATRNEWLGKLTSCPYCTSHWIAFGLVLIFRPALLDSGFRAANLVITAFAVVTLATPVAWVVYRAHKTLEPESPEVQLLRKALVQAKEKILEQQEELKSLNAS